MRKVILLTLCGLISGIAYCSGSGPRLIDKSHFAFVHVGSGLEIDYGSNIKALSAVLGKPDVSFDQPSQTGYKKYRWVGLELKVLPDSDIIIYIKVTNRDFSTKDGVLVGDKMSRLVRVYGVPTFQRKNYLEFDYSDFSETWGFGFTSDDSGMIREMVIGRQD